MCPVFVLNALFDDLFFVDDGAGGITREVDVGQGCGEMGSAGSADRHFDGAAKQRLEAEDFDKPRTPFCVAVMPRYPGPMLNTSTA